jgi:hypothetical protein
MPLATIMSPSFEVSSIRRRSRRTRAPRDSSTSHSHTPEDHDVDGTRLGRGKAAIGSAELLRPRTGERAYSAASERPVAPTLSRARRG